MNSVAATAQSARCSGGEVAPGAMLGRPDLSLDTIVTAAAERLAFEGRDPVKAETIVRAALAGRPAAKAFLRKVILPAPRAALPMPVQSIVRAKPAREPASSMLRFLAWNR